MLKAGAHTITTLYANIGGNFAGSNGTLSNGQTVNAAATTTAIASSVNPSVFGQPITFTAVVGPGSGTGTPTGTVTFHEAGAGTLAVEPPIGTLVPASGVGATGSGLASASCCGG